MIPVVTPEEMGAIDAAAPEPTDVLVERAGAAVARAAIDLLGGTYGRRVVAVCGPGNNGADGRVAARRLAARGVGVQVIDARDAPDTLPEADLVIDAAFGTGLRDSYRPPVAGGTPVLAVDIPSGVSGWDGSVAAGAVTAEATVTFAALKPGLLFGEGPGRVGEVSVADIGLDTSGARAHLIEERDIAEWWAARPREIHKWNRAVWVVAGSRGMGGAAALAVRGAQGAGAGYVRLSVPGGLAADAASAPLEAVRVDLGPDELAGRVLTDAARFGCLVVGPGLGPLGASDGVGELVAAAPVPMVVDGDALAPGWAQRVPGDTAGSRVYTPHDGEFERGVGERPGPDRLGAARAAAAAVGGVVLLKGPTTVVAGPGGDALVVSEGDATLATAGSGDVLSGAIAALLAAGMDPLRAAAAAAFVHGRAGRSCPAVGTTASMVATALGAAISALLDGGRPGTG